MTAYIRPLSSRTTPLNPIAGVILGCMGSGFSEGVATKWLLEYVRVLGLRLLTRYGRRLWVISDRSQTCSARRR